MLKKSQRDRLESIQVGINRFERCVLADAPFPSAREKRRFRDKIETLRGHVCRLFSDPLNESEMDRVERLKDERLFDILNSLEESGWLEQLEQTDRSVRNEE